MKNLEKEIEVLISLYKSRNLFKAENLAKNLIKSNPNTIFLYNILGLILTDFNKIDEAIKCYQKGILLDPKYAMIYNNLGTIYKSQNNYIKAETYFKKSIQLDKKIADPHNNLGNLYRASNKYNEAIYCYKEAIKIQPDFYVSYYNLGIVNKSLGNFEDAKFYLEKSINLNPLLYSAHRALSQIKKYSKNDKHYNVIKKIYKSDKVKNTDKTELAFALGKVSEDCKNYKDAFFYFKEANKFRKKNITFSLEKEKIIFENIKNEFNEDFFGNFKNIGNKKVTPIFIIGMPRSGTTLVEQILSSHSDVYGGDELNYLPELIRENLFVDKKDNFLKNLIKCDRIFFETIAEIYIKKTKALSNNAKIVTDKLPVNFKWVGLIKILFPKAIVLHCKRNARDTSFSIYKNFFANNDLNFAYDLDDIYGFYQLYLDLMVYWKKLFPNFVNDIVYENLIETPENSIRELLNTCNLKWDPNCLTFYENKRPIKTASDIQVRKKIYTQSNGAWKNYDKFLKNFFGKFK